MEEIDVKQELEKIAEETYNFKKEKKEDLINRLKSKLNGYYIRSEYYRETIEKHQEKEWCEDKLKYYNSKVAEYEQAIKAVESDLMF